MKKINLENILFNIVDENPHGDRVYFKDDIIKAMKEACKQVLELAAKNAKTKPLYTKACDDHTPYWGPCCSCGQYDNPDIKVGDYIDKQSILDTINQIE